MIRTIAFDADDTLWINETIFTSTREKIELILADYLQGESMEEALYEAEIKNLKLFGYGIKGFILSTIESCIEITEGKITGEMVQQIIDLGKDMLQHPVHLLPGVEKTILALKDQYQLMIITKGDLFDQETKIARSGIADHFDIIEVVSDKKPENYRKVLTRHAIEPEGLLMVGNSLRSDILPILKLGGRAVHIPFHTTWKHEEVGHEVTNGHVYDVLSSMQEFIPYLDKFIVKNAL